MPLLILLAGACLDRTGDGFVEYGRRTEQGLANQGWKDSRG
jgi:glycogen debranching enzyme